MRSLELGLYELLHRIVLVALLVYYSCFIYLGNYKLLPIFILDIYKVFEDIDMLSIGIW